jgi:hypothetical protein
MNTLPKEYAHFGKIHEALKVEFEKDGVGVWTWVTGIEFTLRGGYAMNLWFHFKNPYTKGDIVYFDCMQGDNLVGRIECNKKTGATSNLEAIKILVDRHRSQLPILDRLRPICKTRNPYKMKGGVIVNQLYEYLKKQEDINLEYRLESGKLTIITDHHITLYGGERDFNLVIDGVYYLDLVSDTNLNINSTTIEFIFDALIPIEYIRQEKLKQFTQLC